MFTKSSKVEAGCLRCFGLSCVQSTDEYIQSARQTRSEKLAEIPAVQGELKYFHELMEELEKKDKDADRECLVRTSVLLLFVVSKIKFLRTQFRTRDRTPGWTWSEMHTRGLEGACARQGSGQYRRSASGEWSNCLVKEVESVGCLEGKERSQTSVVSNWKKGWETISKRPCVQREHGMRTRLSIGWIWSVATLKIRFQEVGNTQVSQIGLFQRGEVVLED